MLNKNIQKIVLERILPLKLHDIYMIHLLGKSIKYFMRQPSIKEQNEETKLVLNAWTESQSIVLPIPALFSSERNKLNPFLDQIWQLQSNHSGFHKLKNVRTSKKFFQDINILLDPKI